jgi:DNA-binding transcriptional LysR family regulator
MTQVTMEWESRLGQRLRVRDLYILSTAVRLGSMAKAARALAMSQPAVSEAIANLEHVVRVRLLDRSPQGIAPTIYANAMLKRAMTVFDELKQVVRDIEFLSDPTTGHLSTGYTDMIASVFPKIVQRFSEKFPRVVVQADLVQSPVTRSLPALRDHTFDLVLGRSPPPVDDPLLHDIHAEPLFEDPMVVVASMHGPWSKRRHVDLSELADEHWILSPPKGWTYELVAAAFKSHGQAMPTAHLVTNSLDLRAKMVAGGRFVTVAPMSAIRNDDNRYGLKPLPVELPPWSWPVTVFTLKNRTPSPVVERFIECAREVAASTAGKSRSFRTPRTPPRRRRSSRRQSARSRP